MRRNSYIAIIIIVFFAGLIFAYHKWNSRRQKILNELASSMALDLYFVSKDLEEGKIDEARLKLTKSIEITNQIKTERHLDGAYWRMFDYHVNGKTQ